MNVPTLSPADWIATSSAVVALCAFFTTVWQAVIARRHNVLAVRPCLEPTLRAQPGDCCIAIENHGLGPGFLSRLVISHRDVRYSLRTEDDYLEFLHRLELESTDVEVQLMLPSSESAALRSEGEWKLVVLRAEPDPERLRKSFDRAIQEMKVTVEYKCLYGKTYRTAMT